MGNQPNCLLNPGPGQPPAMVAGEDQLAATATQAGKIALQDDPTKGMNRL